MATNPNLSSIFHATKEQLGSSLTGLMLPKDSAKVQDVIASYLNEVCNSENDFFQNLTQSEGYMLQAALSMLNAQKELVTILSEKPTVTVFKETSSSQSANDVHSATATLSGLSTASMPGKNALIGAGGGALIGQLLGSWGAVFFSIAGTAVALYISQQTGLKSSSTPTPTVTAKPAVKIEDKPVNVNALLDVIGNLCESLDNLIETFRAQIRRVVNKYESQDKPTFENSYSTLLEGIQSLVGYKRGHNAEDEKYVSKLQTRIEDLVELLDNYDLKTVDYTPEYAQWFDAVESSNTADIKPVIPAIVKNGNLVLKGRVFIPKTEIE